MTHDKFITKYRLEPKSPCPKYHDCKICRTWTERHTFRGSREKFLSRRPDLREIVSAFESLLGKFDGRTISYRDGAVVHMFFGPKQRLLAVVRGKTGNVFIEANDNHFADDTQNVIDIALNKTSARVVKFWYDGPYREDWRNHPPREFLAQIIR